MKEDTDFLKLLNHLSLFLMRTRMAIQELEFSVSEIIKSGRKEIDPGKEILKWKHKLLKSPKKKRRSK